MSILARIKAAFTLDRWQRSTMTVLRGEEAKRAPFSQSAAVSAYRSWIYAAANLNAVAVASQPLRLYIKNRSEGTKLFRTRKAKRRTKAYLAGDLEQLPSRYALTKAAEYGEDYEIVEDEHPVLTLLSKVNPYQNGFDATVLRVLYGELVGNAYLHPIIDEKLGIPTQLWTMPSQYVEIVPGQEPGEPFIKGYRYGATEEQRRGNIFAPDEVIHFKRPNPSDVYYGIGKVEAAWGATMANEAVHEMDVSFFANKARPDYLLVVKSQAHDDELERLEVSIDEKLRGSKRTGRFLTTTADIDLKPLSFPPKDLAGREEIVEEIAAVFGVPVSMLRANDPNLASATVGFASWKQTTVLPLLRMDEETLNQNLLPLFGLEEDAFLAYDNPVSEDERFAFEKIRSMVAGGIMTANEARMREGLEPVEDELADRLLVNGQPLGGPAPAAPLGLASADPRGVAPATADGLSGPLDPSNDLEDPPQNAALTFGVMPEQKDALSDCVSQKIPKLIEEGYPQDQAVAIAYSMCAEGKSAGEAAEALGISKKAVDADDLETKALGDIDTRPPQGVADNARRALEVRARKPESQRGMTAVGIARARDLANRVSLSEDTIRRMVAYFERHEVDKQGSTWDEQGKGWQAWYGWGGDDGFAWAKRKVEEFNRERERNAERKKKCACGCRCGSISAAEMERKDCGTGAGGFQEGNTCGQEEDGSSDSDSESSSDSDASDPSEWSGVKDATGGAESRAINMIEGVSENHPLLGSDMQLARISDLSAPSSLLETSNANFYSKLGDRYVNGMLRGESVEDIANSAFYEEDSDGVTPSPRDVAKNLVSRLESTSRIARGMKGPENDERIRDASSMLDRFDDENEDPDSVFAEIVDRVKPVIEERKEGLMAMANRPLKSDGSSVTVVRGIDLSADIGSPFAEQIWNAATNKDVEEIEMTGMVSTSTSLRIAKRFAINDTVDDDAETQSVILRIQAKRGVAMVGDASAYEENEVLLPPGKFKVVDRSVVKNERGDSSVGILVLEQL